MITLTINNETVSVAEGTILAVAVLATQTEQFRRSVIGEVRGPLCGMGICFECRVTINGVPQQRSCNMLAAEGMEVLTDE